MLVGGAGSWHSWHSWHRHDVVSMLVDRTSISFPQGRSHFGRTPVSANAAHQVCQGRSSLRGSLLEGWVGSAGECPDRATEASNVDRVSELEPTSIKLARLSMGKKMVPTSVSISKEKPLQIPAPPAYALKPVNK